jgi:hypothetical protein
MGAEEPDRHGACPILEGRNQAIVVTLDVEDDPACPCDPRFLSGGLAQLVLPRKHVNAARGSEVPL